MKICLTLILYSFCALSIFMLLNWNLHNLCHFALLEISAVSTPSSLSILLSCNVLGSRFKSLNFIKFFLFDFSRQTRLSVELMSWQITHKFQSVSRCCRVCKLGREKLHPQSECFSHSSQSDSSPKGICYLRKRERLFHETDIFHFLDVKNKSWQLQNYEISRL